MHKIKDLKVLYKIKISKILSKSIKQLALKKNK